MTSEETTAKLNTVDSQVNPTPEFDPVTSASGIFGHLFPKFCVAVDKLSNKALRRLIRALIANPLEEYFPNLKSENEKNAYILGQHLYEAKTTLVLHLLYSKQEEIQKLDSNEKNKEINNVETKAMDSGEYSKTT